MFCFCFVDVHPRSNPATAPVPGLLSCSALLAMRYGGRPVLLASAFFFSLFTLLTPAASDQPGLATIIVRLGVRVKSRWSFVWIARSVARLLTCTCHNNNICPRSVASVSGWLKACPSRQRMLFLATPRPRNARCTWACSTRASSPVL